MSKKNRTKKIEKLYNKVYALFKQKPNKHYNYKQIIAELKINYSSELFNKEKIVEILSFLFLDKKIIEVKKGKFIYKPKNETYEGILEITKSGVGFVICEELEEDVFVAQRNLTTAFNGDKVRVLIKEFKKKRKEGLITKVLERNTKKIIGTIIKKKSYYYLKPKDSRVSILFLLEQGVKFKTDLDKLVLAQIISYGKSPKVKIIQVFGNADHTNTEIDIILETYQIKEKFTEDSLAQLKTIELKISEKEIKKRKDFREVFTFTIDPTDAKDFDDALSFKEISKGIYEIGVHIADVSHYIKENSSLDIEAKERGNSVYLATKVIPMLPELLSNQVCSLRPHEEKLTFSAVFHLNKEGKILDRWFGKTVIYSDHRYTYEQAQDIIDGKQDSNAFVILKTNELAKKLRLQRKKMGSVFFERKEPRFILDENFNPIEVTFKESKQANQLIEEFMLLANREVSAFITKKHPKLNCIYRIHDSPDTEKIKDLKSIIKKNGYDIDISSDKKLRSSLNTLLENIKGKPEQNMIDLLAIRCMSKAQYSTENIGHYGLAFEYYSHFTSPIRRYADLIIHRLLFKGLTKNNTKNNLSYEEICKHISKTEVNAVSAERESIKYLQVKYMQKFVGEIFEGVISGFNDSGMFVELLKIGCEGMVRIRSIETDSFYYKPEEQAIIGHKTKIAYKLGKIVKVQLKQADLLKKQIDFKLLVS